MKLYGRQFPGSPPVSQGAIAAPLFASPRRCAVLFGDSTLPGAALAPAPALALPGMQRSLTHLFRALIVFTGLVAATINGRAADITELQIGFSGAGRVGSSIPIELTASGLSPNQVVLLEVTAPDPRGNLCSDQVARGTARADGSVLLSGTFATGRLDGQLRVALVSADDLQTITSVQVGVQELTSGRLSDYLEQKSAALPVSTHLYVVRQSTTGLLTIGDIDGTLQLQSNLAGPASSQLLLVTYSVPGIEQFPASLAGLQAVDTIVLKGADRLNAAQSRALLDWVAAGGHLIVTSGAEIGRFLTTDVGRSLQPLFQLETETVSVRDLSALQNYVPGAVQLSTNRRNVAMARVTSDQVRSIVSSLDGPLISRSALHGGVVTMITVDLDERPLNSWKTLPRLYEMLIFDQVQDTAATTRSRGSRISSSGISDLSTQLDTVVDAIPPEQRWSSWQIMVMMIGYLLIIGPLDYLVVTKILQRPHLTWLTFPLLIAAGCGLVYWQTGSDRPQLTSREMHIVDISRHGEEQRLQVRSFTSLSSAVTLRSAVNAVPAAVGTASTSEQTPEVLISWHGRAEDVYGGMYRVGGAGLGRLTYARVLDISEPTEEARPSVFRPRHIEGLPMLARGSQAIAAQWIRRSTDAPLFESDLTVSGTGLLEGDVRLNLPEAVQDWIVFFGNRVYQSAPGATPQQQRIAPGESWNRRNEWVRASDLKSFLNGVRTVQSSKPSSGSVKGDSMQVTTPYNPRGDDPLEIMTMVSLFEAAGGEAYLGLGNDALRQLDVSDSIRMNCALLLGRMDHAPTVFMVDDQPAQPVASHTIVRLLLPVTRRRPAPQAPVKPGDTADEAPTPLPQAEPGAVAPDATAPPAGTSETTAPETTAPETTAPGTRAPETSESEAEADTPPLTSSPALDTQPVGPRLPKSSPPPDDP